MPVKHGALQPSPHLVTNCHRRPNQVSRNRRQLGRGGGDTGEPMRLACRQGSKSRSDCAHCAARQCTQQIGMAA